MGGPTPTGHEFVDVDEEVGSEVRTLRLGQFVVGSFWASDNTGEVAGPVTRRAACSPC
jgi:threonine dehydrogenase-like Zn-dependent dehydrogenase